MITDPQNSAGNTSRMAIIRPSMPAQGHSHEGPARAGTERQPGAQAPARVREGGLERTTAPMPTEEAAVGSARTARHHIATLSVEHCRSFGPNQTIPLRPGLNVLVGPCAAARARTLCPPSKRHADA